MFAVKNLGRPFLGQEAERYGCPVDLPPQPGQPAAYAITYNPDLNCMKDARGNTICSDGMRYPPGCPKTPPEQYFTPGVTPDVTNAQGMIEGQQPAPKGASASTAAPTAAPAAPGSSKPVSPVLMVGAGALGAAAVAGAIYYFFLRKG